MTSLASPAPKSGVRPRPVTLMASGSSLRIWSERTATSLEELAETERHHAEIRLLRASADTVRRRLLASPGGYCESRPLIVGVSPAPDGSLGTVALRWVPGDYADALAAQGTALGMSPAGEVGWGTDNVPAGATLGSVGLNVVVATADNQTAVAVRSHATASHGGLAHVPANEGLRCEEMPAAGWFDTAAAAQRAVEEELGLAAELVADAVVTTRAVFAVNGGGLGVAARVDLGPLGVTGEDLLAARLRAVDAWEADRVVLARVADRQPPVGDVLARPAWYGSELGWHAGVTGATPWAALCFAVTDLWPARG